MPKYNPRLPALSGLLVAGLVLASLVLASPVHAQQGNIGGPIAGFVFDGAVQSLRPILGIAGASTLGDPLDAGYQLTAAFVAPRQDSVFGMAADRSIHYFTLRQTTLSEIALPGMMAQPERVVFSPSGTAAMLYASGQVQMISGLPAAPASAGLIQLRQATRGAGSSITSFAVSDDGLYLLFAVGGSIQLASIGGGVRAVTSASAGSSVAFAPGGHDAAVASSGNGAVLIADVAGSAGQQTLAAADASFQIVEGLSFTADGKRLFMASGSAQSIVVLDRSGNRTDVACNCAPTEMAAMGALFRLNELGAGPLWVADAGASLPRVVFVPALRAAQ